MCFPAGAAWKSPAMGVGHDFDKYPGTKKNSESPYLARIRVGELTALSRCMWTKRDKLTVEGRVKISIGKPG